MRLLRIACFELWSPVLPCLPWCFAYLLAVSLYARQIQAVNKDPIAHEDYSHLRLHDVSQVLGSRAELGNYEPEFIGLDRSLIGRAEEDNRDLANNAPGTLNIEQGDTQYWTFSKASLFGPLSPPTSGLPLSSLLPSTQFTPEASDERILYLSLTTCLQPTPKTSSKDSAPQLELYVSTDSGNQQPSAARSGNAVITDEGFGSLNVSVKSDVYLAVVAPETASFDGSYNYELTASIDGFFASAPEEHLANFIDSDASSALVHTNATNTDDPATGSSEQWLPRPPPFSIYVQNNDNPSIIGLRRSVCALKKLADVRLPSDIDTMMTSAGDGFPKQQFHVEALNASSSYYAIVAMVGNSTDDGRGIVGGGGKVWGFSPTFKTKSDGNCALLYNLTFCNSVAYAAPANPKLFPDVKELGQKYDDDAKDQYINFGRSLQQIPCNTTSSSSKYSLARNCDDCAEAYKQWLCAVTIPRCEDYSNPAPYLQLRAVNQTFTNATLASQNPIDPVIDRSRRAYANSRNPMIDEDIKPGPYKEVLPCTNLCYNLVQSCPASLQFACPLENHGLNFTYADQDQSVSDPMCNSMKPGMMTGGASSGGGVGILVVRVVFSAVLVFLII